MNDYFLVGAQPKRNLADAYRQGADVFKQKLTQGELGPMFGPAQGLLQFATGQGITVGDESGTATISPGGGFSLAGKYNEFTVDPFMRQVGANFINPEGNFSVGGSVGMGPQGFYDPRAKLKFQLGGFNQQPMMPLEQIQIQGLPEEDLQSPMVSPARALEMQQTQRYQQENPYYYR